jgi:hypothetical protein
MVAAKMWARRLMLATGVAVCGAAASTLAYEAAGAAMSLGSLALAR